MVKRRFKSTAGRIWVLILMMLVSSCEYQHGLHPVQVTGISGKITFIGEWPAETDWVRLVSFSQKPTPNNFAEFIAYLKGLSDPLPMQVSSYDYVMQLEPGNYDWIIVAWKAKELPITSIKILGEFSNTDSSGTPTPVTVMANRLLTNIDIIADFNKISSTALAADSP